MNEVTVKIPYGFQSNGSWIRHVKLRELNGYDEQYLTSMGDSFPSTATRTTALLKRVVTFNETVSEADAEEILRHLTLGDRIALMLHLRKSYLGDILQCVIGCPACKEAMSLDLSIAKLLETWVPPSFSPQTEYLINVDDFVLKIRPVNGADQEAVLALKNDTIQSNQSSSSSPYSFSSTAQELLVRSCIISSGLPLPDNGLTEQFLTAVSSKLGEIDPLADLNLDLHCPSCQHFFQAPFVVEDFIFQEINTLQRQLEQEVHWLAFNYHWSEDGILSLPIRRRKRYIDLVNRTLTGEGI